MRTCVKSSPWQCAIPDPAGVFPGDPASGHTCKCITMQTRQSLSVVSYSKVIEDIPGGGGYILTDSEIPVLSHSYYAKCVVTSPRDL